MQGRFRFAAALTAVCALFSQAAAAESVAPLVHAHAHNDYNHDRPLLDALDHGFCSVEADIFLVDGQLLVAHDRRDVDPARTLEALYLDPLLARVRKNGGRVYPGGPEFILLVDIKTDGNAAYARLRDVLTEYKEMLTAFTPGSTNKGAVTIILSGDRPTEVLAAEPERFAAIDGRLSDLGPSPNPHLMPLISDNWRSYFTWFGSGEMPDDVREKLYDVTKRAHAAGCLVRFWGIPPREDLWQALLDAGVDLINADKLEQLRQFLLSEENHAAGEAIRQRAVALAGNVPHPRNPDRDRNRDRKRFALPWSFYICFAAGRPEGSKT